MDCNTKTTDSPVNQKNLLKRKKHSLKKMAASKYEINFIFWNKTSSYKEMNRKFATKTCGNFFFQQFN